MKKKGVKRGRKRKCKKSYIICIYCVCVWVGGGGVELSSDSQDNVRVTDVTDPSFLFTCGGEKHGLSS